MKLDLNLFDEQELKILLELFGIQELQEKFEEQIENKKDSEIKLEFDKKYSNGGHITLSYSKKNFLFENDKLNRNMTYEEASNIYKASPTILYPTKLKNFFTDPPEYGKKLYLVVLTRPHLIEYETPVEYKEDTKELQFVRASNTKRLKTKEPFKPETRELIYYRDWEEDDDVKPKRSERKLLVKYVKHHNSTINKD